MPSLLSHNSALEWLRAVPPQVNWAKPPKENVKVCDLRQCRGLLAYPDLQKLGFSALPFHSLVPNGTHQNKQQAVKAHRTSISSIPADLVRELAPGVYVAGPELCFIQMAGTLPLVGAVVLGHELCGSYSHFARMASGFYERPALTSVEKIKDAMKRLKGLYGLARAKKALRWVRDGSASPMETVVSCMLCLPTSMGGFGKRAPILNCEQPLDDAAQKIAGTKVAKVDTGYPDTMTGMEFDGRDYHRDAEKDHKRREALAHEGWTIYTLNVDEATTYDKLREKVDLMSNVPQALGEGEADPKQGALLLTRLLTATRFGIGLNGTIFGVPVPKGSVKIHI